MTDRLLLTIGVLLYAVAVPLLELNESHVFNPHWVAHARLHEVWQLMTNSMIGAYSLWLIWFRQQYREAVLLALLVTGGFLLAYSLRGLYGGSMVHADGSEQTLLGLNMGVLGFGFVVLSSLGVLYRRHRMTSTSPISERPAP